MPLRPIIRAPHQIEDNRVTRPFIPLLYTGFLCFFLNEIGKLYQNFTCKSSLGDQYNFFFLREGGVSWG